MNEQPTFSDAHCWYHWRISTHQIIFQKFVKAFAFLVLILIFPSSAYSEQIFRTVGELDFNVLDHDPKRKVLTTRKGGWIGIIKTQHKKNDGSFWLGPTAIVIDPNQSKGNTVLIGSARGTTRYIKDSAENRPFRSWVAQDYPIWLVYEPKAKSEYKRGEQWIWSTNRNEWSYHADSPNSKVRQRVPHKVVKYENKDGGRFYVNSPSGKLTYFSKDMMDQHRRCCSYYTLPWDTANDWYDVQPGPFETVYFAIAQLIYNHWFLAALFMGAILLFVYIAIGYAHEVTKAAHWQFPMWLMIFSTIAILIAGAGVGSYNIDFMEQVEYYRAISARYTELGFSTLPDIKDYPVDQYKGFGQKFFAFFYLPGFIVFIISFIWLLPLYPRFFHYLYNRHPATDAVRDHVVNDKFSPEEMAEQLDPDVGFNDPDWVIKNRKKQAEDLADLYKANSKVAEAAVKRERDKRGNYD